MIGLRKAPSKNVQPAKAAGSLLSDAEMGDFEAFEAGTFSPQSFHHSQHVRMAWIYLQLLPVPQALQHFSDALQRFALRQGKPDLYHETITWAFLFLIKERISETKEVLGWEEFSARHPDLLIWKGGLLEKLYSSDRLFSELARRTFLLPDRGIPRSRQE